MKKKHIALIIIGIIFILLPAFHTNIWYDESYTVAMVRHSFSEIWQIGSNDVHPVLYYFMLKFINLLFGTNILLYRLFSVIPIIVLRNTWLYTYKKRLWRKNWFIIYIFSFFLARFNKIYN